VYVSVGRTKPDAELALFDFPNPNATSEQRLVTVGPMQRLYFMNNGFVAKQAKALADRLAGEKSDAARIAQAYKLLFGREPKESEVELGMAFVANKENAWPQYMQVLLTSSEFSSVN
jgi:hypothetical protein